MPDLVRRRPAMTSRPRPPADTPSFAPVHQIVLAGKVSAFPHNMVAEQLRGGLVACERMAAAAATKDGEPAPTTMAM